MNEFGEPNMGNPSVRFDEGRERVGHWPLAFQSNRSCLLYGIEALKRVKNVLSHGGQRSPNGDLASRTPHAGISVLQTLFSPFSPAAAHNAACLAGESPETGNGLLPV